MPEVLEKEDKKQDNVKVDSELRQNIIKELERENRELHFEIKDNSVRSTFLSLKEKTVEDCTEDLFYHNAITLRTISNNIPVAFLELRTIPFFQNADVDEIFWMADGEDADGGAFVSDFKSLGLEIPENDSKTLCLVDNFYIDPAARGLGIGNDLLNSLPALIKNAVKTDDVDLDTIIGINVVPLAEQKSLSDETFYDSCYHYDKNNSDIRQKFEDMLSKNGFVKCGEHWFGYYSAEKKKFINI